MSCAATFDEVPIDTFDPDKFHCPECGKDSPIEFVKTDGYLSCCVYCGSWSEDE